MLLLLLLWLAFFSSSPVSALISRPLRCLFGVCAYGKCVCVCVSKPYFSHFFFFFSFSCYVDIEISQNQIAWLAYVPISSANFINRRDMMERQAHTRTDAHTLFAYGWRKMFKRKQYCMTELKKSSISCFTFHLNKENLQKKKEKRKRKIEWRNCDYGFSTNHMSTFTTTQFSNDHHHHHSQTHLPNALNFWNAKFSCSYMQNCIDWVEGKKIKMKMKIW